MNHRKCRGDCLGDARVRGIPRDPDTRRLRIPLVVPQAYWYRAQVRTVRLNIRESKDLAAAVPDRCQHRVLGADQGNELLEAFALEIGAQQTAMRESALVYGLRWGVRQ